MPFDLILLVGWSEAPRVKRLIGRPPESAQPERKATPSYGEEQKERIFKNENTRNRDFCN